MLKKLAIRASAVVLAVAPLAITPPTLVSADAGTGTLFAIAATSQTLVKVDLASGAFTQVADLNTPNQPQSVALASDPIDHRLFLIRISVTGFDPSTGFPIFTQELLTFDSATGAQVFNPAPAFPGIAPQSLVFDTSSRTLFGFTGLDVVRVDPATATLTKVASIASSFGGFVYSTAVDSSTHTLYVAQETENFDGTSTTAVYAVNDQTGAVAAPVTLDQGVRQIGIESHQVYGITECCPANLVDINVSTGVTSFVHAVGDSSVIVQFGTAADPATHDVFINVGTFDPNTFNSTNELLVINDQTAASSTLPLADGMPNLGLAFETPAPSITADSIRADVRSAFGRGSIGSAGVETALLSELNAAADARSRGQCTTAANDYQAFINTVRAQSEKTISAATAAQLVSEARFLIANCP